MHPRIPPRALPTERIWFTAVTRSSGLSGIDRERRGVRVVEGASLENWWSASSREFESRPLRFRGYFMGSTESFDRK